MHLELLWFSTSFCIVSQNHNKVLFLKTIFSLEKLEAIKKSNT